ncbi:MAG: glycoside hydrolase family 3 C-terminal domain-containing protein [Myxococcales bacterium]|nr:glycoside hydrolase family 3 C-terminal domain-containing protein [Myxococcales bacterium]
MCQYVGSVQNARSDNVDEVAGYALALGDKVELVRAGRVGSFLKVPGLLEANYLQKQAESSRLGIPLLIGTDAIHGHGMDVAAATIYPTPIGLAATFDTDLVKRIAQQTAAEMRATGFHWTFSPNVDISRDPRWGRTGETFGEDPWLAGELGAAMVEGYQGEDFSKPNEVLSCVKHLVGGGIADNAVNGSPAEVSERTLREVFLPPFERAVRAGAYTLMPAHNDVNGVPCHAEEQLLTKLLRQQWGFSGFVISDWLDIQRLHSVHRVAETRADADALAVMAGVDMNMHGDEFLDNVVAHVKSGRIPETRINEAARKILYAKFQLGLFENRQVAPQRASEIVLAPAHRAVALEAAQKSLVLLKNEAQTLPLQNARTVLVTGPNADDHSLLGDWAASQPPENITTVLEGMRAGAPEGVTIKSIPTGPIAAITDSQIAAAVKAAKRADSVVLVLGENSLRDNPNRTSGENVDRDSLAPRGRQVALAQAIAQTGKPVIVVLINGAPIGSEALVKSASALIEAWEPGMAGGQAIADVIFGRYNPSGRLPMTVPRSAGQLRTFYNHRPSAYHRGKFRFGSTKPLFRFGDGLSYSTFTYRELNAPKELKLGQPLTIELTVENTGSRAGDDIVLLYLQDVYASVARPVQELKAAQRVSLAPGESRRVRFTLPPEAFTLLDRNFKQSIEPGEFKLTIGQGVLTHSLWLR